MINDLNIAGKKILITCTTILLVMQAFSQKEVVKGWHLLDAKDDGYHGISLSKAIALLKDKKAVPVVVAVMDGGLDTSHYALRNVLWKNSKEIACNNKDDDGNGYTDDINGWNFLGNASGQNVNKESQEAVRVYHQFKPKFTGKLFDVTNAGMQDKTDYALWQRSNELLEAKAEDRIGLMMVEASLHTNRYFDSLIRVEMKVPEYTAEDLENFIPKNPITKKAKLGYLRFIDLLGLDRDKTNRQLFNDLDKMIDQQKELQMGKINPATNFRSVITGDNEDEMSSTCYGNNDVMGGTSLHGTHVSGIIAGLCDSADGNVHGVCKMARIMTVRCVPDGDEHDKDVALGILYAVKNGAKVINMSFGKDLSPHKHWVDDAIKYAAQNDVLIVHAGGNDAKNTDEDPDYPSPFLMDNEQADNVITVGASGDSSLNCGMIAEFTNYGKETVDVLAPGVKIYSSIPGNDFAYEQGTSMSAPIVSGLAALLRSYFPQLSAVAVKNIIEQSVDKSMIHQRFKKPGGGNKEKIEMKNICKTGGIVNAYNAVKLAFEITNPTGKLQVVKSGD
ncbi:MAG: S8 family serine peptidase [Chitinophagaceae bacterium]